MIRNLVATSGVVGSDAQYYPAQGNVSSHVNFTIYSRVNKEKSNVFYCTAWGEDAERIRGDMQNGKYCKGCSADVCGILEQYRYTIQKGEKAGQEAVRDNITLKIFSSATKDGGRTQNEEISNGYDAGNPGRSGFTSECGGESSDAARQAGNTPALSRGHTANGMAGGAESRYGSADGEGARSFGGGRREQDDGWSGPAGSGAGRYGSYGNGNSRNSAGGGSYNGSAQGGLHSGYNPANRSL